MSDHLLRVRDVHVTFNPGLVNQAVALDGVSLDVDQGQFVVILGSNGAGKSTLLGTIAGVNAPDSGTIELSGRDITNQSDHRRARSIARVFQDPTAGTAGTLTIAENLVLSKRRASRRRLRVPHGFDEDRERLAELEMGLENRLHHRVDSLSGGQRQALAVLMAIRAHPELLMLDEHTAALDPAAADRVLDITERLGGAGGLTTLMITHNMHHAVAFGNRTIMMHRGRILFDLDESERAGLEVGDLIERFRQLSHDELSDRTALG